MFDCPARDSTFAAVLSLVEGRGEHVRPTCHDIMEAARAAFRVPVKRLLSAEREFAPTRQAMYWVAREWTEREWTRIGRAYQKDHSTIMHAHELVTGNFEKFRPLVQKIEAVLAQRWPAAHDCIVMARSVGNG